MGILRREGKSQRQRLSQMEVLQVANTPGVDGKKFNAYMTSLGRLVEKYSIDKYPNEVRDDLTAAADRIRDEILKDPYLIPFIEALNDLVLPGVAKKLGPIEAVTSVVYCSVFTQLTYRRAFLESLTSGDKETIQDAYGHMLATIGFNNAARGAELEERRYEEPRQEIRGVISLIYAENTLVVTDEDGKRYNGHLHNLPSGLQMGDNIIFDTELKSDSASSNYIFAVNIRPRPPESIDQPPPDEDQSRTIH